MDTRGFLDFERLDAISTDEFNSARPYPWINPEGLLTPEGYRQLLDHMPGLDLFKQNFGKERRAGQMPHDRYSLEYEPGLPVPAPWQAFIAELRSDRYRQAMTRLLGGRRIEFRFHWHYTPSGCSVSPHTDSRRELGSHLFYFNDAADWNPAWGGETLVLDDGGRLHYDSAPALEDFVAEIPVESMNNHSAILKRTDHAWHAVRTINCPTDALRRVFIVVVNPSSLRWKLRDRLIGKRVQRL
jgi:Rps23 Pro-64 3,4-dihydroxylase Tpa1-like proline 4-hydroxylase